MPHLVLPDRVFARLGIFRVPDLHSYIVCRKPKVKSKYSCSKGVTNMFSNPIAETGGTAAGSIRSVEWHKLYDTQALRIMV
jgi:hypothetical protein